MASTRARALLWSTASALALAVGCDPEPARLAAATEPLIYGDDDRQNWFELDDPALRALARDTSVAILDSALVHVDGDGRVTLPDDRFQELYDLCDGEAFGDEPSVAQCSGVLIDDDLVLTAAHCLRALPCEALSLVFGFRYSAEAELHALRASDVFACKELAAFRYEREPGKEAVDYAVMRLDRRAKDRQPAPLRADNPALEAGEPLTVIGNSAGLPTKIDQGARVLSAELGAGAFLVSADSFHGGSGSGAFDASGALRGVLVRGDVDFEPTASGCQRVRRVGADQGGEQFSALEPVLEELCANRAIDSAACAEHAIEAAAAPRASAAHCALNPAAPGAPLPLFWLTLAAASSSWTRLRTRRRTRGATSAWAAACCRRRPAPGS